MIIATYLMIGPIRTQLLGVRQTPGFMVWQMYSGHGLEMCKVRYTNGEGERLDRLQMLGFADKSKMTRKVRLLTEPPQIAMSGIALCKRLDSDAPEVYAETYCGTREEYGWHYIAMLEGVNLCEFKEQDVMRHERWLQLLADGKGKGEP